MKGKQIYRKRFLLLVATGTVGIILAYLLAITPTVKLHHQLKDIKGKLSQLESAPDSIASLERRLEEINHKIGESYSQGPEFQKNLLGEISTHCQKFSLVLSEFPQVHTFRRQDYEFITEYAKIEGKYLSLLKLLYMIETTGSFGRLVSVNFQSVEDLRTKETKLTMAIYVQTVRQTKDAKDNK